MRKIILFTFLSIFFAGCQNSSTNNNSSTLGGQSIFQLDSANKAKAQAQVEEDKKNAIEQNKVIGEITFGISEREFEKKKKQFLAETKYKPWTNSDIEENKIGDYKFDNLEPYFYKKKLYKVIVRGNSIHYEDYNSEMSDQASILKKMLTGQYGEPKLSDGVPSWTSIEKGYSRRAYGWEIGDKEITMRIANNGIFYKLDLYITLDSIETEISLKDANERDSIANKGKEVF